MRRNVSDFLTKALQATSANVISLIVSVITTLIVPKALGVESFGFFQLYLFYSSYVGLLHLGWNDGVLLRLGGERYEKLDWQSLFSQFWMLTLQQVIAGGVVAAIGWHVAGEADGRFIFAAIGLCIALSGPQYMLLFVLQATARIGEYARVVVLQRVAFCIFTVMALIAFDDSFHMIVVADLLSRLMGLLHVALLCRALVFKSPLSFRWQFREGWANVRAGLPLMVGAMAGSLIIGMVRWGVSVHWSVETFGKVSLALSLANLVLTAVVAVGQVVFPMLRRAPRERFSEIYVVGRQALMLITGAALFLYFPMAELLPEWLPQYEASIDYLAVLFPLFIFQTRSAVLTESFLKALRKERTILAVNGLVLLVSCVVTVVVVFIIEDVLLAVAAILILVWLRAVLLERSLALVVHFEKGSEVIAEHLLVIAFVVCALILPGHWGVLVVGAFFAVWLFASRRQSRRLARFVAG